MKRSNAQNNSYTGTDTAVKILDYDPIRSYICFYSVVGPCEIVIGDNNFDDNVITLDGGVMWEPKIVLTNSVWYRGAGSKLTVLY